MAEPGSSFPAQFAMGILQLRQQKLNSERELAETRKARAAQNFLEQQRINIQEQANAQSAFLQERAQNIGAAQFQQSLAAQQERARVEADVQKEAQLARLKLETDKISLEREQTVQRSIAEFGRTGTAFIPNHAAGEIPKLIDQYNSANSGVSGAATITAIDLPGSGTILQRIGGPGFERQQAEIARIQAQTEAYRQDSALDWQRSQTESIRRQQIKARIDGLTGGISESVARNAQNQLESLRKLASQKQLSLSLSPRPEDRALARRIADDPSSAFPEGSPEATRFDQVNTILSAFNTQVSQKMPMPASTDPRQLDAFGVSGAVYDDPIAAPSTGGTASAPIVRGRVSGARPTPGPGTANESAFKLIVDEGGRQRIIDVDEATFRSAEPGQPLNTAGSTPAPRQQPASTAPAAQPLGQRAAKFIPPEIRAEYANPKTSATRKREIYTKFMTQ